MAILNSLDVADKAKTANIKNGGAITDVNEFGASGLVPNLVFQETNNAFVTGLVTDKTTRFDDISYYTA